MTRLASVLAVAMLAWGLATTTALAKHGRWRQVENNANCEVWFENPRPSATVTWTGDCVNGRADGNGEQTWRYLKDGEWKEDSYTGVVRDGKRHGRGVLQFLNGGRYEGDFRESKFNGQGVLVGANGYRYEGG